MSPDNKPLQHYSSPDLIHELRERGYVLIAWSTEDLYYLRPDLDDDQRAQALATAARHLEEASTERGWDIVQYILDRDYPETRGDNA